MSAVERITESQILPGIAPGSFEENDGLFVAIADKDMDNLPRFVEGCRKCEIPATVLSADEALRREPGLTPTVTAAVQDADGTMDAKRLHPRFCATAHRWTITRNGRRHDERRGTAGAVASSSSTWSPSTSS